LLCLYDHPKETLTKPFLGMVRLHTNNESVYEFVGRYAVNITSMMAGGILAAPPPVILGLIFQRYFVSGIVAGAVKG
jgi:multiple sugar transport system permease protein